MRCRTYRSSAPALAALLAALALTASAAPDPKSLKKFEKLMNKGSLDVKVSIDDTLDELGLAPSDVIPLLEGALRDLDAKPDARHAAASACIRLGEMGHGEPLVPALMETIEDPNGFVELNARLALQRIGGEAAAPAMPAVMRAMANEEGHHGSLLSIIQAVGEPAVPFLIEGLESDQPQVRASSARALRPHGRLPEVRAPLIAALDDPDPRVRLEAADNAFHISPWDQEIVDALVARLDDPDVAVVERALKSLIRPMAKSAAGKIQALLEHPSADVRKAAAYSLRRIGADPAASDGALIAALDDPSQQVRTEAALSLAKTAPDTPGLVDILREGLSMRSPYSIESIAGLARLGKRARPAAPELLRIVERFPSDLIQSNAATALAAMAPVPELAPKLARLLPAASPRLQTWLWYAIAENDPERDDDAVAGIMLILVDEDESVVISAIAALARLGPRARAALPALRALEAESEGNVRKWCEKAIEQIEAKVA